MFKKVIFLVVFLFLFSNVFAGVTGKIAGKVVDSETNQPLPGVNVVIKGTTLGAATDIDGNYIILNVPAGNYQLQATMIGYTAVTIENVRVSIDITTRVDFSLSTEVLEAGETVTIVAERPMIQKDEVSTRHFVSSEEIALLPIDSFQEIARRQAGVVGNHFRGGRSGEVLVLVDGIPVKDPAGTYSGNLGGFTVDVPEYGIQELEVSLGGFGAEYGNVQSGILNLALKEGKQKYAGRLRMSSTDFRSDEINTRLLRDIYEFNLSGPEPLTTHLLPKLGINLPGSLSFSLSGDINDKRSGYYPNEQSLSQSYQGKITYNITPTHKLVFGGILSNTEWNDFYFPASKYGPGPDYQEYEYKYVTNDTLYHYIYVEDPSKYREQQGLLNQSPGVFDGDEYSLIKTYYVGGMLDYLWGRQQNSDLAYILWTHTLSPRTFYEVRLNTFYTNYHYATQDVEDRDGDGDTDEDLVWDINKPGPHPIYRERESNYWWVRGDDPGYRDQKSWTHSIKADIVSQVTNNHLLKGGLEFLLHRTKAENISWTLNLAAVRKDIWDQDSYDFAAYIQDKLEFAGIIALIGMRFDLFNPNGLSDYIYFPGDYNYPYTRVGEDDIPIFLDPQKAKNKYQFSPRLGISHPITDRDVLHFTYGHYFQRPDGYYLYRNNKIQSLTKVGNYIGNPDLNPEKTVAYEVGVEHQFTNDIKATITGYYKDVTNLMNWQKVVGRSIQNIELNVFTNADYGNIKGLEFTFTKRAGRFWGATMNYTYSIAKGRASNYLTGYGSFTDAKRMDILDFDQTHTVNANVTLRTPADFGLSIANIKPLANWIANVQFEYGSGLPYSSYGSGKVNDMRMPWTSTTDLRLVRQFKLSNTQLQLFVDVFNIFDRKNIRWLGSTQYYEYTGDPSIIRRDTITGDYVRNPQVYSDGRQARVGLAIEF
ncbi:MAG: TonB-dependent receptor [bacterium]|nr:TonB-dependent receptor [bacterium]